MVVENTVNGFKSELAFLSSRLIQCRNQTWDQGIKPIFVCEQILVFLLNSELLSYQLQIHTCIEQIDDTIVWTRSQLIGMPQKPDFMHPDKISTTYKLLYKKSTNELINNTLKAMMELYDSIPADSLDTPAKR
ncbi:hypothetical protein QNI16_10105 [Cytophagaceae bacterium YF14B1]|uniref:Uncharacterized protein n=1 Tax=Xanthocytophaga flava TaxID=3048013 RepID=A0AAE3QPH0_9BACT|nr:hypothetical protein [Xanthocytophaga flavus]MDJ1480835.1 hypothetical protein [Xanthocytophaga flavus]